MLENIEVDEKKIFLFCCCLLQKMENIAAIVCIVPSRL